MAESLTQQAAEPSPSLTAAIYAFSREAGRKNRRSNAIAKKAAVRKDLSRPRQAKADWDFEI